jgi:hypothetical protein
MLYASIEGYHSIRETILGLLANARRTSGVFEDIYMSVYRKYANFLADSRLKDADMKRLYIMDSTTLTKDTLITSNMRFSPKKVSGM